MKLNKTPLVTISIILVLLTAVKGMIRFQNTHNNCRYQGKKNAHFAMR